jgi:hypothetical protein
MKNEFAYRTALRAAYEVGERVRIANNRHEWTDEEIEAAAEELRRRLLNDGQTP